MKNKYFIRSKISEAKFREIIKLFAGDLTACQIALFSGVSRMCVKRVFLVQSKFKTSSALNTKRLKACFVAKRMSRSS